MQCRIWLNILAMCVFLHYSGYVNGINLYCRTNKNKPTDWWFIYKPPRVIFSDTGTNFSFIRSGRPGGRWIPSQEPIDRDSMLRYTLWPLYEETYKDRIAVLMYTESKGYLGTSAMGVLMVDGGGNGVWLGHTVPGYPDLNDYRLDIPQEEMHKGQMFACISLTLDSVNTITKALDRIATAVTEMRLPRALAPLLPAWLALQMELPKPGSNGIYISTFRSRLGKNFTLMARIPGDKRCLYQAFARTNKIILDVYGTQSKKFTTICVYATYGVRNIKSLSLKDSPTLGRVKYIGPGQEDRSRFAVSTAVDWQTRGRSKYSFWVCVSNLDKEDLINYPGGMLVCVEDYSIWRVFSNMKVEEPNCS